MNGGTAVRRTLAVAALVALAGLLAWSAAFPGVQSRDEVRLTVSDMNAGYLSTSPTAADTITGPAIRVDYSRRCSFRVSNQGVVDDAADSIATIQVCNKDSIDDNGVHIPPYIGWEDANGKPGVSVIDNFSGYAFGESIGYRTIELVAPGSNRIPFFWARPLVQMRQGVSARVRNVKFFGITTND